MTTREAVIVSTARTPIAKAFRGTFNITHSAELGGHAMANAIQRAGVEPAEIEDVVLGCGLPEGVSGGNLARSAALRAGAPVTTGGFVVSRYRASGLQAISTAAHRIIADGAPVMLACGLDHITLVQPVRNPAYTKEPWLNEHVPHLFMPMIDTAEVVAKRYNVSREAQDEYALQSQQRTAAAQEAGRFDAEIVPMTTEKEVKDRSTGEVSRQTVTLAKD